MTSRARMAHLTLSPRRAWRSWHGPSHLWAAHPRGLLGQEGDEAMARERRGVRRRDFLMAALGGTAAAMAAAPHAGGQVRPKPTPACGDSGGPTPPQTEGPYFKARSPLRASLLEPGMSGARLVVEGVVLTVMHSHPGGGRRFLAGRRQWRVRQRRLSTARASALRRRRPLSPGNHRARALSGADPAHPRGGRGAPWARAH